jgi:hypothetical protein
MVLTAALSAAAGQVAPATLDLNAQRPGARSFFSLPGWLLITMMTWRSDA